MPCTNETVTLGDGTEIRAIVCTRLPRCGCGNRTTKLCDWKVPSKKSGTCDKPLCGRCTTSPAPDKDLCPKHAKDWAAMLEERKAR